MTKHKAYKFRLSPNRQQASLINKTLGCCRLLYNCMLDERQTKYQNNDKSKHKTEKEYKQLYSFMSEIDSVALQQSRLDLQNAYKHFFTKVKKCEKTSLKFKSRKNPKNSYRTLNINNSIRIIDNKIKFPKLGWIKFKKSREVYGKIRNATITRDILGRYYVSILTEQEIEHLPKSIQEIGVDLGIKEFLIDSNGNKVENPQFLRKYEQKLKYEQRKLSRKKRGSNRYFKQRKRLFKIHEKIRNVRADFLHKLSSKLINENQVISLEDLNIKNMLKNHKLAKSISDTSWHKFVKILEYKADWYGRTLIKIDKFFASSQLCYSCGYKNTELTLSQRWWTCKACGVELDRDVNAAQNVLCEGKRILSCRDDSNSSLNNLALAECS